MNRYFRTASWSAALALTAMGALAQTAVPPNPANPPATVGVTPQEAAEAAQKAVPRSDTGTLVRTAPSAADKASAALSDTAAGTGSTATGNSASTDTGTSPATTGSTATSTAPMERAPAIAMRRVRADRN